MHCGVGIWHFVVEVFILIADTMHIVVLHIVVDGQIIMNVTSAINILRDEIEPNIIPVWWHVLIHRQCFVSESVWKWQVSFLGFEKGHLSFKELILTRVVMSILVGHSKARCKYC